MIHIDKNKAGSFEKINEYYYDYGQAPIPSIKMFLENHYLFFTMFAETNWWDDCLAHGYFDEVNTVCPDDEQRQIVASLLKFRYIYLTFKDSKDENWTTIINYLCELDKNGLIVNNELYNFEKNGAKEGENND